MNITRPAACCIVIGLTACASKVDYAPKTQEQLDEEAQEHHVFYEGWKNNRPSAEDSAFTNRFWNGR